MKKKTKTTHIHLRPFDKEHFDFNYFHDLSKEDQKYLLGYLDEEINARYVKTGSIYTKEVLKKAYQEIKSEPEKLRQFNKRLSAENDSRKKKKLKRIQPIDFIKLEWQRENSRRVWERRNDAYSTLINTNKIDENKGFQKQGLKVKSYVAKEEQEESSSQPEDPKDVLMAIRSDHNKEENEMQFFIRCQKANRTDYFIWSQLIEVVHQEEITPEIKMVQDDLKDKNDQYERKEFTRSKYMLYLLNCVQLIDPLIKNPDGIKTIKELKNVFELVIYPYKKGKLQREKV